MYKSPFYIIIIYPVIILLLFVVYYIFSGEVVYLYIVSVLCIWFIFYLKNLVYIINDNNLIKKTGRFLKIEKRLKLDKIISFSHYNFNILKINIIIIKHLEGKMLITFLKEEDIKKIIEKL